MAEGEVVSRDTYVVTNTRRTEAVGGRPGVLVLELRKKGHFAEIEVNRPLAKKD